MHNSKKPANKQKAPRIIACECGTEILVVPDVKEMSKVIDAHVKLHCQRLGNPAEARFESDRIWEQLAAALLQRASYAPNPIC